MIDNIAIENALSFGDVYWAGLFLGACFVGPLIHIFYILVDILLECLIRYRRENRPFRQTFLDITKYLKKH